MSEIVTKSFAINDSSAKFDIVGLRCLNGYINITGKKIYNNEIITIDRQSLKMVYSDCYEKISQFLRARISDYYTAEILTFLEMKVGLKYNKSNP